MRSKLIAAAGALCVAGFVASAQGAVAWSNPSGSTSTFDWSAGQNSDSNLFGSPAVIPTGFVFSPVDFSAASANGVADQARDTFSVVLDIPSNGSDFLDKIMVTELGDYSILGTGTVKAQGLMVVTVLDAVDDSLEGTTYTAQLAVAPGQPISTTTSADGEWNGSLMIDIPDGVRSIQIVMDNNLQATTAPGGVAFIEKKNAGVRIDVIVPEPATMTALGAAGVMLLVRRRKA